MNTREEYNSDEERNTKYAVFLIHWKSPEWHASESQKYHKKLVSND